MQIAGTGQFCPSRQENPTCAIAVSVQLRSPAAKLIPKPRLPAEAALYEQSVRCTGKVRVERISLPLRLGNVELGVVVEVLLFVSPVFFQPIVPRQLLFLQAALFFVFLIL
jgi:hypothetical protein